MAFLVKYYNSTDEKMWDDFVLNHSINGTFLQTRKFVNYHEKNKFKDCSLCIYKGSELIAVVLACEILENGKKTFFAHKGTTFGGITIAPNVYSATQMDEIMKEMLGFLKKEQFEKLYIKMVPSIYQKKDCSLIDYFFYNYNFKCYSELNYYLNLKEYKNDLTAPFSTGKRRDFRYALRNNLKFKKLETKEEIAEYYNVLQLNLDKLGVSAVHTLQELYDLKFNRFNENIDFFGVYFEERIIAGSMLFYFDENIVHTQYLSSDPQYLKMYPMDYLIASLIKISVEKEFKIFTFGICTEDQGRYLNLGLSRFKEGFGTEYCINRSYEFQL